VTPAIPKPTKATRKKKAKKPTRAEALKKLKARCNKLWADAVKKGRRCIFLGEKFDAEDGEGEEIVHTECKGYLQAMHGFGKKAHPSVRYELWNGVPGCGAAHTYYTWQPHRWENWLRKRWGARLYRRRYLQACRTAKHDYEALEAKLEKCQ
jgi:hypothetical protein